MAEVEANLIDPLLGDVVITRALVASADVVAFCGNRFAVARDGFEPGELLADGQPQSAAWPYILFGTSEDGDFDFYAQTPTLLETRYLVRCFMREDFATALGKSIEAIASEGLLAIQKALQSVNMQEITRQNGELRGIVHGCELLPTLHRRTYGDRGRRVCEMGVHVRILSN